MKAAYKPFPPSRLNAVVVAGMLAPLSGCALYGPSVARTSHLAYNEAVQAGAQQELLLNLVRLRYTEAPEFLAINSISSQMSFDAQLSVGSEFGEIDDASRALVRPGASVGYAERPTVTFTPQRGAEFTRQLVAPVELDSIYLLTEYGWRLDRVLRLLVAEINGLRNAIGREDGAVDGGEGLAPFARAAGLLGDLEQQGALRLALIERGRVVGGPLPVDGVGPGDLLAAAQAGFEFVPDDDPESYRLVRRRPHYVLEVDEAARRSDAWLELCRLLGLDAGKAAYGIDRAEPSGAEAGLPPLRMRTRSVLGAMAYLSHAVEAPERHLAQGLVRPLPEVDAALSDLLRVRVGSRAPDNAANAVRYRGYWFYIAGDDRASKAAMGLLTSLIRIEVTAGGAQSMPILTLPVSQ